MTGSYTAAGAVFSTSALVSGTGPVLVSYFCFCFYSEEEVGDMPVGCSTEAYRKLSD